MNRDTGSAAGSLCIVRVISVLAILCFICSQAAATAQTVNHQQDPDRWTEGPRTTVSYRFEGRSQEISSGNWVPASADLLVVLQPGQSGPGRSYRLEIFAIEQGERVMIEVPGLQEWEKQTRKWTHTLYNNINK